MPEGWLEFAAMLDACAERLASEAEVAMQDIARKTLQKVNQRAPEGTFGTTPFLKEALLENSGVNTAAMGFWTFGFASMALLPEPEGNNPPEHTIKDFLIWWNEQGFEDTTSKKTGLVRKSGGDEDEEDEGGGVKYVVAPWWDLTHAQKDELEKQRAEGQFGGEPPAAPYWWVQNVGSMDTSAWIQGSGYWDDIVKEFELIQRYTIRRLNDRYLKNLRG